MYEVSLRVSADPWALEGPFGFAKRPQTTKISKFLIMHETLLRPNLSHIDFLGHPRCNHNLHRPNILYNKQRGPKRTQQSLDIDEKQTQTYI